MKILLLLLCLTAQPCFAARRIAVPRLPESPFIDTEVSTNVAFSSGLGRAATLDLSLAFTGGASNTLHVAFGRDEDANGVFDFGEVETVFGWETGRYFVEDVRGGLLAFSDEVAGEGRRDFRLHVVTDATSGVRRVSAVDAPSSVRWEIPASLRPCLFRDGWNMVRVTRRGVEALSESLSVAVSHHGLVVIVQ